MAIVKQLEFEGFVVKFYEAGCEGVVWQATVNGQQFTDGERHPTLDAALISAQKYLSATSVEAALLDFLADALDDRGLIVSEEYWRLCDSVQKGLSLNL